jgi:hypothetical protein
MITHIAFAKSSLFAAIALVTVGLLTGAGLASPNALHPHYIIKVASFEKHKKTNHQCDAPQRINYTPRPTVGVDECYDECSPSDPNRCFANTDCPNCNYSIGDNKYECQP